MRVILELVRASPGFHFERFKKKIRILTASDFLKSSRKITSCRSRLE